MHLRRWGWARKKFEGVVSGGERVVERVVERRVGAESVGVGKR